MAAQPCLADGRERSRRRWRRRVAVPLGLEPISAQDADAEFVDVRLGNVHAPNIYAVAAAGITTGVTADTFAPDRELPGDQMASLLVRAFGDAAFPTGTRGAVDFFIDVDPDNVHADNIYLVADVGVSTGTSANTYDPSGIVKRDQMASLLMRTIDLVEDAG